MGLEEIKSRIKKAELNGRRVIGSVNLIAVSKVQPLEKVEKILLAGQRVFGENRVQEASQKWPAWKQKFSTISLHLLGPLQTNKVKEALGLFDVVHSLDRESLPEFFRKAFRKKGVPPNFLYR